MIEVFKTNVNCGLQASRLVKRIHKTFRDYKANFDLQDCDRILRIKSATGQVHVYSLIRFLKDSGCEAQVLPDEVPPPGWVQEQGCFQFHKIYV
jgi:hypothetical protein